MVRPEMRSLGVMAARSQTGHASSTESALPPQNMHKCFEKLAVTKVSHLGLRSTGGSSLQAPWPSTMFIVLADTGAGVPADTAAAAGAAAVNG